jgi:hypothetical protein
MAKATHDTCPWQKQWNFNWADSTQCKEVTLPEGHKQWRVTCKCCDTTIQSNKRSLQVIEAQCRQLGLLLFGVSLRFTNSNNFFRISNLFEAPPSRAQDHEKSKKHQDKWAVKLAAARQDSLFWGTDSAAAAQAKQQRKELESNPLLHTQFESMQWLLAGGRPILDYSRMESLLMTVKHKHVSDMHWSGRAAWSIVEAIDSVAVARDVAKIQGAQFFSISLDEATSVDNRTYASVHAYIMESWERKPIFLGLTEVRLHYDYRFPLVKFV